MNTHFFKTIFSYISLQPMRLIHILGALCALILVACNSNPNPACNTDDQCLEDELCKSGDCVQVPYRQVYGTITRWLNGEPAPNVKVSYGYQQDGDWQDQAVEYTDANGNYSIPVPEGERQIRFSDVGYHTRRVSITVSAGDERRDVVIMKEQFGDIKITHEHATDDPESLAYPGIWSDGEYIFAAFRFGKSNMDLNCGFGRFDVLLNAAGNSNGITSREVVVYFEEGFDHYDASGDWIIEQEKWIKEGESYIWYSRGSVHAQFFSAVDWDHWETFTSCFGDTMDITYDFHIYSDPPASY